jgi:hypothetical protein
LVTGESLYKSGQNNLCRVAFSLSVSAASVRPIRLNPPLVDSAMVSATNGATMPVIENDDRNKEHEERVRFTQCGWICRGELRMNR